MAQPPLLPAPPQLSLTLLSIPFSHYNLRAVWALRRAGLLRRTRVVRVLPLLHIPVVLARLWWAGQRPRAADRTSSPHGRPVGSSP